MAGKIELKEEVYQLLKEHCMNVLRERRSMPVDELLNEMMRYPEIPMHYPYHHFIMPAALLTLAALEQGEPEEALGEMLDTAIIRAKNVLAGFCGNYGACGAGVGAGIFLSIFTDTSPHSEDSWQWVNELTGRCLQRISTVQGPRCCKRTAYLSVEESLPYINEKLGLHLALSGPVHCEFYERNADCKRTLCPYFPLKGAC